MSSPDQFRNGPIDETVSGGPGAAKALTDSRLAALCADAAYCAFLGFHAQFRIITRQAKERFQLKPQIPISEILRKLSRISVRIFSGQNFRAIDNRNLLYPCNLRNLWLDPFSVFWLKGTTLQEQLEEPV